MSTKYYVVNIDPNAEYEWDKVVLRNPISGERPDLGQIVAEGVGNETGSYLIAIEIEVKILEKTTPNLTQPIANTVSIRAKRQKRANS